MKLYKVKMKKIWTPYYVEATSFDDAADKVLKYLEFNVDIKNMFDADGSLVLGEDEAEIETITVESDLVIR